MTPCPCPVGAALRRDRIRIPHHRGLKPLLTLGAVIGSGLLAGCALGPRYHQPAVSTPVAFKELQGWKPATPSDAIDRGEWWSMLHDPVLDDLERQLEAANLSFAQAAANYEQARQLARADVGTFFPTISASGSATRAKGASRGSVALPSASSSTGAGGTSTSPGSGASTGSTGSSLGLSSTAPVNSFSASLGASWSLDFWGRLRRQTESDVAAAQASAADLANARLSLESTLAQDYVLLRAADERVRLRNNAVDAYTRTLQIAQNKYKVGLVARSDVSAAQAQLDAAKAQAVDAAIQRAQFEHAIAVLVGRNPSDFSLPVAPSFAFAIPVIPTEMPSTLLERRPDIATAERDVAAANARVGVQIAGYFPSVTLTADGGYASSTLSDLFRLPNRFWSVGANLGDTLFDFGRRRAELNAARASYDASVAGYRHTVLTAFQQVEDNLAALHYLEIEAQLEESAVNESAEAARIALNEYNAGTVDFTTVATAQVNELTNRQTALNIRQSRLTAAVTLVESLGGGWTTKSLPTTWQVLSRSGK